jgi:hypothetical protein
MRALYSCTTESAVALTGTTIKTCLGVQSHANHGLDLKKVRVELDGVTASAVPALVELCYCTFATNAPGTNSTAVTVNQTGGRAVAVSSTFRAAKNWTAEPTVLTVLDAIIVPQFMGLFVYDFPLGDEYDCNVSEGFAIRITPTATVNVRCSMTVARN